MCVPDPVRGVPVRKVDRGIEFVHYIVNASALQPGVLPCPLHRALTKLGMPV
jgi:hypothetical protein